MDIRLPLPKDAAQILRAALAEKGLQASNAQALDLVSRIYGYNSWYAMQKDPRFSAPSVLKAESFDEYRMKQTAGNSCWIAVGPVSVRLGTTEEGLNVALYAAEHEESDPLDLASVEWTEAKKDPTKPDPSRPLMGCRLPARIAALEFILRNPSGFVSSKRTVSEVISPVLEWLEDGAVDDKADLSEEAIEYQSLDGSWRTFTAGDLYEAQLAADGCFKLKDGKEFYLLDENLERWVPTHRK